LEGRKQKKYLAKLEKHIDANKLPELWDKWIAWKEKHIGRRFLFAMRPLGEENLFSVGILNVQEAIWIMKEHYPVFREFVGREFDPMEVALEFENPNSLFWKEIEKSHILQGILFGFGEKNAYFFDREREGAKLECISVGIVRDRRGGKIRVIPLPTFRSYYSNGDLDPVLERYREERKEIQKKLKRQNLVDAFLLELGYTG
jgi:hypothetical protein